ncbi:MAG: hypothetical protein ACFE75_09795 [Candidatus Hodarchaeota archaeon]
MSVKEKNGIGVKYRKMLKLRIAYLDKLIPKILREWRKNQLIEQKKRLEHQLYIINLADKTYHTLNKVVENNKEYEAILERKKKGEYVEDLIKRNRYTAQKLNEQDKKTCEEYRIAMESEKKRIEEIEKREQKEAEEWLKKNPDIRDILLKTKKSKIRKAMKKRKMQ